MIADCRLPIADCLTRKCKRKGAKNQSKRKDARTQRRKEDSSHFHHLWRRAARHVV
jgi:hypothetical protein